MQAKGRNCLQVELNSEIRQQSSSAHVHFAQVQRGGRQRSGLPVEVFYPSSVYLAPNRSHFGSGPTLRAMGRIWSGCSRVGSEFGSFGPNLAELGGK